MHRHPFLGSDLVHRVFNIICRVFRGGGGKNTGRRHGAPFVIAERRYAGLALERAKVERVAHLACAQCCEPVMTELGQPCMSTVSIPSFHLRGRAASNTRGLCQS